MIIIMLHNLHYTKISLKLSSNKVNAYTELDSGHKVEWYMYKLSNLELAYVYCTHSFAAVFRLNWNQIQNTSQISKECMSFCLNTWDCEDPWFAISMCSYVVKSTRGKSGSQIFGVQHSSIPDDLPGPLSFPHFGCTRSSNIQYRVREKLVEIQPCFMDQLSYRHAKSRQTLLMSCALPLRVAGK